MNNKSLSAYHYNHKNWNILIPGIQLLTHEEELRIYNSNKSTFEHIKQRKIKKSKKTQSSSAVLPKTVNEKLMFLMKTFPKNNFYDTLYQTSKKYKLSSKQVSCIEHDYQCKLKGKLSS